MIPMDRAQMQLKKNKTKFVCESALNYHFPYVPVVDGLLNFCRFSSVLLCDVVVVLFGFNVAFNNVSVISRRCLVSTGSSMLTFIVLPH